jgi:hypothetical protein
MVIAATVLATLFLLSGLAQPAEAGVEPSPFKVVANKLDSVSTQVDAVLIGLEAFLEHNPPLAGERVSPGEVNRLMVLGDRVNTGILRLQDSMDRIGSNDYQDDDGVMGALQGIRDSCGEISDVLRDTYYWDIEDGFIRWPASIRDAFESLADRVDSLDQMAWYYLEGRLPQ